MNEPLNIRWLSRVPYAEALAIQEALFASRRGQHLLLLEHDHVFTYGPSSDLEKNLKCDPQKVGADFVSVKRGGDITYHGPGQLVGYPVITLPAKHTVTTDKSTVTTDSGNGSRGPADSVAHVFNVEQLIIDTLNELGLSDVGRFDGFPGVWVGVSEGKPRKISAIGVRVGRNRTMHGFALNVSTDMTYMREHIVPCGIGDYPVTSLHEEGINVSMKHVVDVLAKHATQLWGHGHCVRQDVVWEERVEDLSLFSRGHGAGEPVRLMSRLARAGVTEAIDISSRKPDWIRPRVNHGSEVLSLKKTLRDLSLVTVCEEAGCPNLSECWSDGTATFMVLGERCTRACGFCLVDTRKPLEPDLEEPSRVAEAVRRMGLSFVVLTMVARDDLLDHGMGHVAECVRVIREISPDIQVETLISDAKGSDALELIFAAAPDVLNHNIETVARLQRAVRPSAGYARSLSVLSRSKRAGLTTKSGLIVGMGETDDEVLATLSDLGAIGVDIVTIGQYLRPTTHHLPVSRWVEPAVFEMYKEFGECTGIGHVESSPLTRSSYHAKDAAHQVSEVPVSIGVK